MDNVELIKTTRREWVLCTAPPSDMTNILLPESLRQILVWLRQRVSWDPPCSRAYWKLWSKYKSYILLDRLSAIVKPWLLALTDSGISNKPPRAVFAKPNNLWPCGTKDKVCWSAQSRLVLNWLDVWKPLVLHYSFFQPADNIIQRNRELKIRTVINRGAGLRHQISPGT